MAEKLYTIPVNEAFEASAQDGTCGCPLCALYNRLEDNEIDTILGASMMEDDIRMKTNEAGFCRTHYDMMLHRRKKLPMMLTMQTHLATVLRMQERSGLLRAPGQAQQQGLERLMQSCYVCGRLDGWMQHMLETTVLLWDSDSAFREKMHKQPYFCLPHYTELLRTARGMLSKRRKADFYEEISAFEIGVLEKLSKDVDWYCKKFDYRYTDEPWYDSKDAPERSVRILRGDMHRDAGAEQR